MTDYNTLKVQDLQKHLKERSLPVSGKKPDLIARLQEHDAKNASAKPTAPAAPTAPPAAAPTSTLPAEDDIDWLEEDTPIATTAPPAKPAAPAPAKSRSATSTAPSAEKATTAPAAAALAAGGQGQVPNPTAVPNQKIDTDPSATSDLTVKGDATLPSEKPAEIIAASGENIKPAEPKKSASTKAEKPKEPTPAPVTDFTSGLAKTELEKEIEARKRRAAKFGGNVEEASTEATIALEREKKLGVGEAGSSLNKIDQPLAERGSKKRGRGNTPGEEGGRERGGKRRQVNQRGRNGGERRQGTRRGERQRNGAAGDGATAGGVKPAMVSEADKKKAEDRKTRFAGGK
ncbi:MAG: hypothetical protein M1835_006095 [Candelina submexicana]|nr:MAG: hypothetical protein M1835_006095 [Candelina submexicana]